MDSSVPVFEKPHTRPSISGWTHNIQTLQNESRTRRFQSYELQQRSNQLRNESSVTTRWDNCINNDLLRERILDVEAWKEKQRFTREEVRDEMRALQEEKHASELHLESLQVPLMVTSQCLSNRDQRVPTELTRDQLGEELNKELHVIENNKRLLTDVCHAGWEKLKDLSNVFCRLEREIQNKEDALKIEYHVMDLTRESSDISYKTDPTRIPAQSMSEESYVYCIEATIKIAEQLMSESKALREKMFKTREQAKNQMYAQSQMVEMIMRRRVYEQRRARDEMHWQKFKLEEHMAKVDREIESLRAAVADKINPTKLVETRLEKRTWRPVLERVQDKPMSGLIEEYGRVHTSTNLLEKKLEDALTMYHGLYNNHQRVSRDLQHKNQALETDSRLVDIRKPIQLPYESHHARNLADCKMIDDAL